ncbi:MAG: hypothetical protein RR721_14100 [Aeromonas sp.]|uniref:hypothetical protein n=1 Tax=Aeromonas sp. TaxID=647 RepID=UPI002FC5D0BF
MTGVMFFLQILILLGIGCVFLFRHYLFSYSAEKGKNLATQEDIEEITRKIEDVKIAYLTEIEKLKIDLSLLSKKQDILLDEKIRVFKKLQKQLVDFKKYCEASVGSHDARGDFHPTLDSLTSEVYTSTLLHLTALHYIMQEDFIFLSKKSKDILNDLHSRCVTICNIELYISSGNTDSELLNSAIPMYENSIKLIEQCLQGLYDELRFPNE